MLENKLTIIVPTKGRPSYAKRAYEYWSNSKFNVFIIDGSSQSLKLTNNSNLSYIHKPIPFPDRLAYISEKISTDYTCLCSDDDFHLFSSLQESIKYLDQNNDYSAITGLCLDFHVKEGNISYNLSGTGFKDFSLSSDSEIERVSSYMSNYMPALTCSVMRSELWKISQNSYQSLDLPIFALGELMVNWIASYAGKCKALNKIMWLRSQGENIPIRGNIPSLDKKNRFYKWIESSNNIAEKIKLTDSLATILNEFSNKSLDEIKHDVSSFFHSYYIFSKPTILKRFNSLSKIMFRNVFTLDNLKDNIDVDDIDLNYGEILHCEKLIKSTLDER